MPSPEEKLNSSNARVSVNISGSTKKKFFDEVIKTGITEAKLARKIIAEYYERSTHMRF